MPSDLPIRVLIVDGDRVSRHLSRQCLEESPAWEFEFWEADSGKAGIESARAWRPDCILLDLNLPDMEGLELFNSFLRESGLPCAIVVLTARGSEELGVKAMKAGASDHLTKARLLADRLPYAVVNAVERFRLHLQIERQRSDLSFSEVRYQVLLEAIPQMVWTANREGQIQYANRRWSDYTGLTLENTAGLGWDRLLHPEDRERTWNAWNQAQKSRSEFEVEHRLRRASDHSYRWHLVRAVPLTSGGEISSWLGTSTEIEDQKRAEDAASEERRLQGIGRLAGGIAHDFNNLLVCVLGGASCAMQSLPASHPAQEMLQDVIRAGDRLAELTRRMLAYAGKGTFHVEPIDVAQLVHDACESIHSSIPESIQLEIRNRTGMPPVRTDSAHMRQAVVDMVLNAVEAIGEDSTGRISVRTDVVEIDEVSARAPGFSPGAIAGKYVALEVRDTGCGMAEETRNKIFDPFFTTKFVGRGLGLAAVQGFVRSTGGGVEVDSKLGEGTALRVFLPVMATERVSNATHG